jgi:hypothetical protein
MSQYSIKRQRINRIRSYVIAGKLLHMIALLELMVIIFLVPIILKLDPGQNILLIGLKYYVILFLISLPFFSQLDARSRYQNYKQIKDQIFLYGYDHRIFKPVLKSRCQRDAAWLSAKELGYGKQCKDYFYKHGYRWYHILPDFVFKKPHFLLTFYFWRTTFFSPRYVSKVDYNSMMPKEENELKELYNVPFPTN